jgi:aminoglycoside 6'-N-acetyltransferase
VTVVEFRPLRRDDLPQLAAWFAQPHVRQWWPAEPLDVAGVEAAYGPCIDGDDPTELFVISADQQPVGMIQRYLLADEPQWREALRGIADVAGAAGIDYLIGQPSAIGRGVGTAVIAAFVDLVFGWQPVASIVVTVQQANPASWRVLEKAGFQRVWAGELDSPDPSDAGPEYAYVLARP